MNRIVAFENCTNNLLVFDYDLKLVAKLEGIEGPPFGKSLTWTTVSGTASINKVLWLKGNHQGALIDIDTMEETDRAPLFGTVNTYADNIPLLVASHSNGNWCGYFFMGGEYHLSWMKQGGEKEMALVDKVIPEAKTVHGLQFDASGKYLMVVIGSSRELPQSSFVLVSLAFDRSFDLKDYFRLTEVSTNFAPSLRASTDQNRWLLNTGKSIVIFKVDDGTIALSKIVADLASGSFPLTQTTSGRWPFPTLSLSACQRLATVSLAST